MGLNNPQSADHIAAQNGSFEPQRSNNFSVEFPLGGSDKEIIILGLQSIPLPNEQNEEIEIPYQNERRYIASRYMVDEASMSIRDAVDVDTRGALLRWRKQVFDPTTGNVGLAKDYKKTGYIKMTAPDGTSERLCTLIGAWPKSLNGGNLDMESSDKVVMEVSIRYDKAIWEGISGA